MVVRRRKAVKRNHHQAPRLPHVRTVMPLTSRGYHGAEESRLTGHWYTGSQDINAINALQAPRMRARVRDLVRNFPPFIRAVNGINAFVVGKGARFQSLALTSKGDPDYKLRKKIEERFCIWMESADVAGKLHLYEMEQLAKRQECEGGEFICLFTKPRKRDAHFAIQMYESENLSAWNVQGQEKNTDIYQGIEFDVRTGEPLGYHFQTSYSWQNLTSWREPAKNVLHGFNTLRPGQLRGVPPFAPAIMLAKDMGDYTGAELDAAKMAAKWLAFVTSETPDSYQAARMPGGLAGSAATQREDIEWLENAAIEYLRPGEKIDIAPSAARPGDSFDRFTKFVLRMVSITINLPYEILSGDYQQINYSTSKASRNDFIQFLAPEKFRLEMHFMRPIFYRWLEFEALTQDYMRGYWLDPERFRKCMFIPAGLPSVDPLRDGKADIDAIASGIRSPQMVILGQGHDPEEVVAQRAAWAKLNAEHGIDPISGKVSTAMQANPAKLGAVESMAKVTENADKDTEE